MAAVLRRESARKGQGTLPRFRASMFLVAVEPYFHERDASTLLSAHPEVYGGRRAVRPLVLDGLLLRAERDAAHLAEGDRHALAAHRRHAVLRHVGAVAVQHEDRADGERHADGRVEDAVLDDLDLFAEEDRLLGKQRERDERADEVVVVDVRRDAVALRVPVVGGGMSE